MEMTNAEIAKNYREAKDKRAQITILADLNNCSVPKIKNILKDAGQLLPRGVIPEPAKKKSHDSPLLVKQDPEFKQLAGNVQRPQPFNDWFKDMRHERQRVLSSYLMYQLQEVGKLDDELLKEYQQAADYLEEL